VKYSSGNVPRRYYNMTAQQWVDRKLENNIEIGALFTAEVVKGRVRADRKENSAMLLRQKDTYQVVPVAHLERREIARSES